MHTIDLSKPDFQKLAQTAGRISALLQKPGTMANKDVAAVLDDLLGPVYAAISSLEEGFVGKTGESELSPPLDRAKRVSARVIKTHGNGMAGLHFNSSMFRVSALLDKMPKALANERLNLAEALA